MLETLSQFVHRPNRDEVYTSICMRCFGTAGSGKEGPELEAAEARHVCNKQALREREEMVDRVKAKGRSRAGESSMEPRLGW
jgi:hypothetical protein